MDVINGTNKILKNVSNETKIIDLDMIQINQETFF